MTAAVYSAGPMIREDRIAAGLTLVSLLWAGMLLGVSFLATPAKFAAPSLTLPVALDVGRHTFAVFNRVEIAGAALVLVLALVARDHRLVALAALGAGIVALQALWLLPALDARVETILAGGTVPSSPLHTLYIGLDATKLLVLLTLGAAPLYRRTTARQQSRPSGARP